MRLRAIQAILFHFTLNSRRAKEGNRKKGDGGGKDAYQEMWRIRPHKQPGGTLEINLYMNLYKNGKPYWIRGRVSRQLLRAKPLLQ